MKKRLFPLLVFVFVFVFATFTTFSQNYFQGSVIEDDTANIVSNAIVTIEGTSYAETTDANGRFTINYNLPNGEHVVTITKKGYDTKYLLIDVAQGKKISIDGIRIVVNKKESKRRKKEAKIAAKLKKKDEKARKKKLEEAQKEKEKNEKELEKNKKKLQKKKGKNKKSPAEYEDVSIAAPINTELLKKYSALLNVPASSITNVQLYEFIDQWSGTTYKLGGETKEGIDCSSFTQRLYTSVYDLYIERTAEKQFNSKLTDKFQGQEFLHEGDLIFFEGVGENGAYISHVGVYLQNGKFVHATSHSSDTGTKGVKISDLNYSFWKQRFVAAGRRIGN